jgi:hypothetical protein
VHIKGGDCGFDWFALWLRWVLGCYEHGTEPLGCIKGRKDFLFNWASFSFSRTASWSCCVIYMLQVSQWLKELNVDRKQPVSYLSFIS